MGLRFRRSISLCKGVKLNFGLNGVSISTGIPGFHRTVHSSGRVTTSIGIPGTGLSYVDIKNKKKKDLKPGTGVIPSGMLSSAENIEKPSSTLKSKAATPISQSNTDPEVNTTTTVSGQADDSVAWISGEDVPKAEKLPISAINTIFEICDKPVQWIDVISYRTPHDDDVNPQAWTYLRQKAVDIFEGNVDAYLDIIQTINPYDDLLEYAENITFAADEVETFEVEFLVLRDKLPEVADVRTRNLTLQDYVCAVAIRMARDTFALLPVENVIVTAMDDGKDILSVRFDRGNFSTLEFGGKDASDLVESFPHNMKFNSQSGFSEITRI